MGDLSEHFSRVEFECKCGICGFDTVDAELIKLCEVVRVLNGNIALEVASGARCDAHNMQEGGGIRSKHLLGKAADLYVSSPTLMYYTLCDMYPDKYGFGLYRWGVHVDVRAVMARWK